MTPDDLPLEPPADPEEPLEVEVRAVPPPRAAPPRPPRRAREPAETGPAPSDGMGGLIPYHNKPALFGYYCAVFALFPVFPIGLVALYLGLRGLRNVRENPAVRGTAHAWIGIVVGGGLGILWFVLTVWFVIAAFSR